MVDPDVTRVFRIEEHRLVDPWWAHCHVDSINVTVEEPVLLVSCVHI